MKTAKKLLALLLCVLMLGALALPAFAAEAPAETEEEAPDVLISPAGDLLGRIEFFLSHSGLFLRMRLVRILNFFRGLAGMEPILL